MGLGNVAPWQALRVLRPAVISVVTARGNNPQHLPEVSPKDQKPMLLFWVPSLMSFSSMEKLPKASCGAAQGMEDEWGEITVGNKEAEIPQTCI